jgi:prepilin-type N-terminal cleavage/methylation domain-containing protein
MKREKGFTLVEIAIVLVVVGLLLIGVLKGQEMVMNARIRSAINEYNNVASAAFIYQDRYRRLPGDDNTANARWGASITINDGDGDGVLEGAWNAVAPVAGTTEAGIFWHHLRNDGIVAGSRDGTGGAASPSFALPQNAFNGVIGVQDGAFVSAPNGILGLVVCQSNVEEKAAIIIDTRIDDGTAAGGGSDTGALQGGTNPANPAAANYVGVPAVVLCREMS